MDNWLTISLSWNAPRFRIRLAFGTSFQQKENFIRSRSPKTQMSSGSHCQSGLYIGSQLDVWSKQNVISLFASLHAQGKAVFSLIHGDYIWQGWRHFQRRAFSTFLLPGLFRDISSLIEANRRKPKAPPCMACKGFFEQVICEVIKIFWFWRKSKEMKPPNHVQEKWLVEKTFFFSRFHFCRSRSQLVMDTYELWSLEKLLGHRLPRYQPSPCISLHH